MFRALSPPLGRRRALDSRSLRWSHPKRNRHECHLYERNSGESWKWRDLLRKVHRSSSNIQPYRNDYSIYSCFNFKYSMYHIRIFKYWAIHEDLVSLSPNFEEAFWKYSPSFYQSVRHHLRCLEFTRFTQIDPEYGAPSMLIQICCKQTWNKLEVYCMY